MFDPDTGHLAVGHVRVILAVQTFLVLGEFIFGITLMDPLFEPHFQTQTLHALRKQAEGKAQKFMMTWVDFGVAPT